MKVAVSTAEGTRVHRDAIKRVHAASDDMERILKATAAEHRRTHKYKNQTGHLEAGSLAGIVSQTDNERIVALEQADDYASYVARAGFNDFPKRARKAVAVIDVAIQKRIGKGG